MFSFAHPGGGADVTARVGVSLAMLSSPSLALADLPMYSAWHISDTVGARSHRPVEVLSFDATQPR